MAFIEKIKLHGFKSFPKITEIPFQKGFSAILGANGSGKTNVTDAICFVLGKSSAKQMRAEKSSNLIYNGGKKGSAMKQAEVSLYFNNEAGIFPVKEKKVKISRIVRQKGNSIYKLNNEVRTRQEILDVLGSASINPDGHNIVLQGDITRFTMMPPKERRELIEEIAGISVYEDKKNKAVLELDKVQEKLNNASIILTERGTYLKELKKDKDQAVRYKQLEGKIKSNKATLIHSKIRKREEKRDGIESRVSKQKSILEKISNKVSEFSGLILEKKEIINKLNFEIERKGDSEQVGIARDIESIKTDLIENKSRLDVCKNEIEKIRGREKQLRLNVEEIDQQDKEKLSFVKGSKRKFKEISDELDKRLNEDSMFAVQLDKARKKLFTTTEKVATLRVKRSAMDHVFESQAIKEVSKKEGIHGVVSDLGEVNKDYSLALSIAAGSRIRSVVAEDDSIAADCIRMLKSRKLGFATFLPLNKINSRNVKVSSSILKKDGVVGLAIDLVRFDRKYKNIFSYVFSNTLIVDTMENARKIGVGRVRMVTLDGSLIETSGAMVGGYRRSNVRFKEKETLNDLDNSEIEIERLKNSIDLIEQNRKENEERINVLREQKNNLEVDIKNTDFQIVDIHKSEKEKTEEIFKENRKEVEEFKREIGELMIKIKEQETFLKKKRGKEKEHYAEFKGLNVKRNKLSEEISKYENGLFKEQGKVKEIEGKVNNINIDKAKIVAEISGLKEEFKEFENEKVRRNVNLDELRKEINEFEKLMERIGNVNLRALEIYEEIEKEFNKILDKVTKLKEEKEDVLVLMNEIESKKTGLFMKTFKEINGSFRDIFLQLTTKGEALLELENKEKPLEEGVDIKIKLVGNKYFDIRSLSGGEKSLAALAFIFAIQDYSPAVFYLLDEVDAALDRVNSEKLSRLIKKYSGNSQYIVISHNDAILSDADQIYGVSMKKDGRFVSQVVSMKV
ncbi:hypothetical protein CL618_02790 [archaeon]|nr:hypothetical protein [archaeon]|tara:strand:+ start:492 stop:3383 length:2892 start_codon:yes stop_codon:yes gene_type:complete